MITGGKMEKAASQAICIPLRGGYTGLATPSAGSVVRRANGSGNAGKDRDAFVL